MRRARIAAAVALAVLLGTAGCTAAPPAPARTPTAAATPATTTPGPQPDTSGDLVTARGRSFELAGRPFRFVGVNIYDAAATDRYSCRAGTAMDPATLERTLRVLHEQAGVTVLRFWAYQTYTQGATDFSGVDRVLAAAKANGMKVVPVLEDGPGDCTTSSVRQAKSAYRGDTWFTAGYRVPYGNATLSYRDYVARITAHYEDDPTILGWSMMNEAETRARDASGASVLVDFARDVSAVIRATGDRHLITLGTQSNGAPGASGPDFTAVYSLPGLDFAEVHDWGRWGSDAAPMPGSATATPPPAGSASCRRLLAPIGCSFALAARLDKPLLVGEAGIRGDTPARRTLRARQLRAKMDAAFAAGAGGYLVWSVTTGDTDGYDVRIDTGDPLLGQLRAVADGLG